MMRWEAYFVETLTGMLGPRIRLVGGSWEEGPLNKPSGATVKLETKDLAKVDRWLWQQWSGSVVLCYGGQPIIGGPITKDPDHNNGVTSLEVGDMGWSMMAQRVFTGPTNYGPGQGKTLAAYKQTLEGMSYGDIAWQLVSDAMNRPNGKLPIVHATPVSKGDRKRVYEGFNLSNNNVAKLLTELTEVINGPDIVFRPKWTDEYQQRVVWEMHNGTHLQPELGQRTRWVLDTGRPRHPVNGVKSSSKWEPASRVYVTGAGQGAGTAVEIVDAGHHEHMPWLEKVDAQQQVETPAVLIEKGRAAVAAGGMRVYQLQVTLPADMPRMPLYAWHTGEEITLGWQSDELGALPNGEYAMRVLSRKGDFNRLVQVEFQTKEVPAW